ncbi:FMN reductase [Streptomyces sp. NPDC005263]|uniref:FMN reductase n=1 Tax=Streptomyces sp. NPDC005263 TaxID=3364711 RepID=UPI00369E5307
MRLVVVSAGLSVPSSTRLLADRLAAAVGRQAPVGGQVPVEGQAPVDGQVPVDGQGVETQVVETQVVELRDLAVEIAHNFTNGFPGPRLAAAIDAVTGADGLIVVTPVFSASYSGLFKSFFDVLSVSDQDALAGKPVLIAATGGSARHSLVLDHALRPLFAYLRAVVVPTGVYAASEDWGAEGLDARIERAAGELAGLMTGVSMAAQVARSTVVAQSTPADAPADARAAQSPPVAFVPFEERLAALRA